MGCNCRGSSKTKRMPEGQPNLAQQPAHDEPALDPHRELLDMLAQQARLFDATLSAITDFAYSFNREGRFTYVNKALLDLWGLKLQDALGKDFFDLNYPDALAAKLQRQILQVPETGRRLSGEPPYTSPTGKSGYYEYIFAPVFAEDGSVEAVAGSTRDITARVRTERTLARDAAGLANVQDSVIVTDLNGIVSFWNDGATRVFGWTAKEMVGQPMVNRVPAE